ncbi:hypothetical protein pb186bvf_010068 [Paramecium bursaria]
MNLNNICLELQEINNQFEKQYEIDQIYMLSGPQWIYLIGCGISIFEELFLMILFIFNENMRQSPGDIFFGNLFFELMMSINLFMSALSNDLNGPIQSQSLLCQFTSGLGTFSVIGELFYVISFFHFVKQKVSTSLQASGTRTWKLHIGIILITLVLVILVFTFNLSGKYMDGMCSIQIYNLPDYLIIVGYSTIIVSYIIVGAYSITYILRKIPRNHISKAQKFISFSVLYFVSYLLLTILTQTLSVVAALSCYNLWGLNLEVIYGFNSFFEIVIVISLPIIRLTDPDQKKLFLKSLGLGPKKRLINTESTELELNDISILDNQIRDKVKTEDNLATIIQNNIRQQFMSKMIAGLQIDQYNKHNSVDIEIINHKSDNIFDEKKTYFFIGSTILSTQPKQPSCEFIELLEQNYEMTMINYCPIIFHVLMNREKEKLNVIESLNLEKNIEKIKGASKNDGGKSGQFFFYSSDNKVIIKTISQTELKLLLQLLPKYFEYLLSNPDSLIAKIYGIFTFEQTNERPINIIVMKNIARTTNTYRIYDLKGSSYDREVAKKDTDLQKVVLKDLDFLNFERYLFVNNQDGSYIVKNATKDAIFFRSQGLIDYSMIVFKIINDDEYDYSQGVFQCEDKRYRYHLGIIDYLQEYNVQKKVEKFSKKLIRLNQNLDTSSQDPQKYCSRFSNFIIQIVKND